MSRGQGLVPVHGHGCRQVPVLPAASPAHPKGTHARTQNTQHQPPSRGSPSSKRKLSPLQVVVVVSPLISLMVDQVLALQQYGLPLVIICYYFYLFNFYLLFIFTWLASTKIEFPQFWWIVGVTSGRFGRCLPTVPWALSRQPHLLRSPPLFPDGAPALWPDAPLGRRAREQGGERTLCRAALHSLPFGNEGRFVRASMSAWVCCGGGCAGGDGESLSRRLCRRLSLRHGFSG